MKDGPQGVSITHGSQSTLPIPTRPCLGAQLVPKSTGEKNGLWCSGLRKRKLRLPDKPTAGSILEPESTEPQIRVLFPFASLTRVRHHWRGFKSSKDLIRDWVGAEFLCYPE